MKIRAIGIANKEKIAPNFMKASDYSNENFNCVEVRTTKNNQPVIIMQSKKTTPLMWKVCYGYSQVYFRTFAEAIEFCNSRGMKIMKGQM